MLLIAAQPEAFFTDAEVLQELIHVYLARNQRADAQAAVGHFAILMGSRVEPMYADDVKAASRLADQYTQLSARDLIHLAVMMRVGANQIVSADRGFDGIAGLQRLDPADVASWRGQIVAS